MTCSVLTDRQTDRQTNKKAKTEAALSGLSEFLTSAHHQGAVQKRQHYEKKMSALRGVSRRLAIQVLTTRDVA